MAPSEQLPDSAPMPTFFLPNFLGILFALTLERFDFENFLAGLLHKDAHRFGILGLGVFAIANVNSFLGGSVILARIEYNVKLPNLYADTSKGDETKAILFNCVQRGHQNFLESFPLIILAVLFTAFIADRPNVAGFMLLVVSIARITYAIGYKSNITNRMGGQLLAIFTMSIGIGYGFLVGATVFGIQLLQSSDQPTHG
jgi:glutathione S-transferase